MDDLWSWNTRIQIWISSTRRILIRNSSNDNRSIRNNGSSRYTSPLSWIKMLSGSIITWVNYARTCLNLHMCRILVMSINSRRIRTSNITSISISSSSRAEIRCNKSSKVTTMMHLHTSNSSISNIQQLRNKSNQCQRIQLYRLIIWMRWAMVYHLLRVIRHIYSRLRIPVQWSCITPLWETKVLMQRQIHQLHSTAKTIQISSYLKATRCSSTQRLLTKCPLIYTRSIHRLEHLRVPMVSPLAITTSTLSIISLLVWKTLLYLQVRVVKQMNSSTRTRSRIVRVIKLKPSSQLASDTSTQKMIITSNSTITLKELIISNTFQITGPHNSTRPIISVTKRVRTYIKCEGIRNNSNSSNMTTKGLHRKMSKTSRSSSNVSIKWVVKKPK